MSPRSLCTLLLLLLPACAPLARWVGVAGRATPLPAEREVIRGRLENGLTYYIRVNREPPQRAELRLAVDAGSVLEDDDQRGLAHVVEHMAFNGTANFRKQELVDYLEGVGMRFGPDINAYTSFDETVYTLTLPTDREGVLESGFQILEDWAHAVTFDSVEVEKERAVVIEEWRLGQGAGSRMLDKQFPVLTRRSRYAERLPIGTPEALRTFSHAALRRFYRDWYRPDLMAVVAVGDFDPVRVERLIRERFGRIPRAERPRERRDFHVPDHRETLISVAADPEATGSSISLYLKREPRPWLSTREYRDWIVESLANAMLTNRLSERTQRPGSPFLDVSSFQGRFIRPLAAHVLTVRVPDRRVEQGLEELLVEVERVEQHGFTLSELEREKREMMRRMEQQYAERDKITSSAFAADYVSQFLYGGTVIGAEAEYRLYQQILPRIRLSQVNAATHQWMRDRNRVVLVTAPRNDSVRPPDEDRLKQVLASAVGRRVRPYVDSVSDAPLVPVPPRPGTLVAERVHPGVGVTEWTLGNGVRVLLKPTDFRKDEVLLAARSPGGTSLVPDRDFVAALTASAVVQAGGLGRLDQIELRKRLAGKVAGVGADIGEMHEGLSGAASPQDLETLFQLVYLKFTAPRLDSAAVEAYRTQAKSSLASRLASPEQVFLDTLRLVLAQNHPRAQPPSSAIFDRLDIGRSFEIYRERFADASDFTFYLTGAFAVDSVRPLVLRYLGSLPSLNRRERGRDLGIRPPPGVVRRQVRKGLEPKAQTQLVFTGEMEFGRENVYTLGALADLLRIRLRESLREELGGTYGVQVGGVGWAEPQPQYRVAVGFGSDPGRVDELVREVFQEIDRLKRSGPTADELLKLREMAMRSRETELRSNHFWISQIMSFDRSGWPLEEIQAYPAWVERLDAATLRAAAARYLDTRRYVLVSLLPEAAAAPARGTEGLPPPEPTAGSGVR